MKNKSTHMELLLFAGLAISTVTGCGPKSDEAVRNLRPYNERNAYQDSKPGLSTYIREAIQAGNIVHGMSPDDVTAVMGEPKVKKKTSDGETWYYHARQLVNARLQPFTLAILFRNGLVRDSYELGGVHLTGE